MKSPQGISLVQTQRLSLNAGLVASIRILRTDAAGLTRYLEEQAAENPHLQIQPAPVTDWRPAWAGVLAPQSPQNAEIASAAPSLIAHITGQIDALRLGPGDRALALAFADALEPSGWLGRPLVAIAAQAGQPVAAAQALLMRLHRLDPPGMFARNLAECLSLQAQEAGLLDPVLAQMIGNLALLASADTARIGRQLDLSEAEVLRGLRTLRSFDPKPGAQFEMLAAPVREPDLVVTRGPGGWQVALNRSALPTLRLAEGAGRGAGRGAAQALMRAVEGRNTTLLLVGVEVLLRQTAALETGPGALVPMTMADVAAAVQLNQSTVSRIVAGVAVDTPRGTWWLRALFSGRVGGDEGAASAALRDRLARLVAAEDRRAPLSDEALALALSAQGGAVARRTVAKYRAALRIAPAHRRRVRGG